MSRRVLSRPKRPATPKRRGPQTAAELWEAYSRKRIDPINSANNRGFAIRLHEMLMAEKAAAKRRRPGRSLLTPHPHP